MSKSIKLKNNNYIDSSSIVIDTSHKSLNNYVREDNIRYFEWSGFLGSENMPWKILTLPRNFCGFIMFSTLNREGIMNNDIIKIAYSYGNPILELVSSTAFASKLFSKMILAYTHGGSADLILVTNGLLQQISIQMTFVGSVGEGSFAQKNEVGNITGLTTKTIDL